MAVQPQQRCELVDRRWALGLEAAAGHLAPCPPLVAPARLLWNPTDLMTLTGEARREVRETTVAGASSAFTSAFSLKADYELLTNLILNGLVYYDIEDFEGIARQDEFLRLGIGARYLIGRNVVVEAGYEFEDRDSDAVGDSFTENMLKLSLFVKL